MLISRLTQRRCAAHFFNDPGGIEQLCGDELHGLRKQRLIALDPGVSQSGKAFFFRAGQAAGDGVQKEGVLHPAPCKTIEADHFGVQAQGTRFGATQRGGDFAFCFSSGRWIDQ